MPGRLHQFHLRRRLDYSIGSWLPGHYCHLFLYGLDVWWLVWLRPVSEGDHSLGVYAFLFGPILRRQPYQGVAHCYCCTTRLCCMADRTCSSRMTYLYSIRLRGGSSICMVAGVSIVIKMLDGAAVQWRNVPLQPRRLQGSRTSEPWLLIETTSQTGSAPLRCRASDGCVLCMGP